MLIKIRPDPAASRVSDDLFGCNMEVTRRTCWTGLSAQMAANRKFRAAAGRGPAGWTLTGGEYPEENRDSVCRSRSVILSAGDSLEQEGGWLAFREGVRYDLTLWVRCPRDSLLVLRAEAGGRPLLERRAAVAGREGAQKVAVVFTAPADALDGGRLTILCREGKAALDVVSLLPADHYHGMRRDVLDRLRELRPASLRFPGGCYAECYPWKDGLLEPDFRPPIVTDLYEGDFLLGDTYGQDCHEIGTDEFIELCRYVGARPELTAPIIRGNLANTLDWLEYCNGGEETTWGALRARRGHPRPYEVHEWYIGNEIYYFGGKLAADGGMAAAVTNTFITAMKQADPALRATVAFYPGNSEWNRDYVTTVAPHADKWSLHFYMTDQFQPDFGHIGAKEGARVVEDKLLPMLEKAAAEREALTDGRQPFSLDEWAFTWGRRGSVVSAYVDARILSFLCANAARLDIEKALFFHPVNEGMIAVGAADARWDTTGEVWQLFMPHRGGRRLAYVCDDVGAADVLITADDRGEWTATLINRRVDAPCRVEMDLDAFPGAAAVTVRQLAPVAFEEACDSFRRERSEAVVRGRYTFTLLPGAVAGLDIRPAGGI